MVLTPLEILPSVVQLHLFLSFKIVASPEIPSMVWLDLFTLQDGAHSSRDPTLNGAIAPFLVYQMVRLLRKSSQWCSYTGNPLNGVVAPSHASHCATAFSFFNGAAIKLAPHYRQKNPTSSYAPKCSFFPWCDCRSFPRLVLPIFFFSGCMLCQSFLPRAAANLFPLMVPLLIFSTHFLFFFSFLFLSS